MRHILPRGVEQDLPSRASDCNDTVIPPELWSSEKYIRGQL